MDARQLDFTGKLGQAFSFGPYIPPGRRYKMAAAEFPRIPLCYLVQKAPKVKAEILFDGKYYLCKGKRYFGDVSFNDYTDSKIRYRKKVKDYGNGLYKVYLTRDPVFRMPYAPAHPKRTPFDILTEEEKAQARADRAEERRERMESMTEEERDEYARRKASESLSRAKLRLQDYVLLNKYDYFLTLTFDDVKVDGTDIPRCMEKLKNWLMNMVQKKDLQYVLVPEYHPSSGRLHCHALINGALEMVDSGTRIVRGFNKPVRLDVYRRMVAAGRIDPDRCRILRTVYNVPEWRNGFTTAISTYGNPAAIAAYMVKYIAKGADRIFGKYFWASKNQTKYPAEGLYDVSEAAYHASSGKVYGIPGVFECKIENHVVISKVSKREQRMLDQITMILDANGEVWTDAAV